MGLLDFFRPKHKHSRIDVRTEAVRQLGDDDTDILVDVARRDPESKIREIALRKLTDPQVLLDLAGDEADGAIRTLAQRRASELSVKRALDAQDDGDAVTAVERVSEPKLLVDIIRKATSSAARHRALLRLEEPRALAEVAQKADDPQMRAEALGKISEPKVLRDLAISEATRAIQLAAIARLTDPPALRAVAERGKSKAVRQAAKDKLTAIGAPIEAPREAKEPKQKKPLDAAAEARLKQRKIEAEMRRRSEDERKNVVAEKKVRLEQEHNERLQRMEAEEAARKAAPEAKAAPAPAREREREPDDYVDESARVSERPRREHSQEDPEKKALREAEKAAREAEKARKVAERAAQATENLASLESLTERLEAMAKAEDAKDAGALLKEVQGSQAARGPLPDGSEALRARFEAARTEVASKLTELREAEDWRRWGNVPKLEALIGRAESLAKVVIGAIKLEEGDELDPRKVSRELRAMQKEWKEMGRPPREKADQMWERFKAACDIIYEGNKQGLDAVDEERQANLKMKQELCEKVEALVASAEAESNPKGISDQLKQLQEDWKKIGPVPKSENEAIWARFRGACDKFFSARKEAHGKVDGERQANLDKQLALVARAEALKGSVDWKGTADQLKEIQEQWKQIGFGKKPESDEAWKKLRAACDHFFERRNAHFGELDQERTGNLAKKEELVAEAQKLAAGDGVEDADATIRELMARWKKIGPVPKEQGDEVWARFGQALDALREPEEAPVVEDAEAIKAAGYFSNKAFEALKGADSAEPAPPPKPAPIAKPAPVVKAEPVPAPVPAPAPVVKAEPVPAPVPAPAPAPVVKAEPVPAPVPAPAPVVKAEPVPAPAPVVKAEPVPAPAPAPVVKTEPVPAAKPAPVPTPSLSPTPTPTPSLSPTPNPSPSPSPSPSPVLSPTTSPTPTPSPPPPTSPISATPPAADAPAQDAWPALEDWTLPDEPSK